MCKTTLSITAKLNSRPTSTLASCHRQKVVVPFLRHKVPSSLPSPAARVGRRRRRKDQWDPSKVAERGGGDGRGRETPPKRKGNIIYGVGEELQRPIERGGTFSESVAPAVPKRKHFFNSDTKQSRFEDAVRADPASVVLALLLVLNLSRWFGHGRRGRGRRLLPRSPEGSRGSSGSRRRRFRRPSPPAATAANFE